MSLDDLADALLELRRYVENDPEHVRERLNSRDLDVDDGCDLHVPERDWLRINANIMVGLSRILGNPEILRGYLYGAAQEIREHAERRRKERGE